MALPTLKYPTHRETLPSGKEVTFRPYTMNEEKILLTGKEGGGLDLVRAVVAVVKTVVVDPAFEPLDLSPSDFEFLFLRLRAKSVDSHIKIRAETADGVRTLDVDLERIESHAGGDAPDTFEAGPGVHVKFKRPTMRQVVDIKPGDPYELLASCLVSVAQGDDVQGPGDFELDEAKKFIMGFDAKAMEKLRAYVADGSSISIPVEYEVTSVGGLPQKRTHRIRGLADFLA